MKQVRPVPAALSREEQKELNQLRVIHYDWYSAESALILSSVPLLSLWVPHLRGHSVSPFWRWAVLGLVLVLAFVFVFCTLKKHSTRKRYQGLLQKDGQRRAWEREVFSMVSFETVTENDVYALSAIATEVVRNHFDPLIGTAQNDYMLARFQSVEAILSQLQHGYRYYWVMWEGQRVGFMAFYPREDMMYLSKFYIRSQWRGLHIAGAMLRFIERETRKAGLSAIFLNVNRGNEGPIAVYHHLGFTLLREEKNDIGNGFFMDDFVLCKKLD